MSDKELYNMYQDSIPDYETFKSIKDKKLKALLFTGWIAKFGSKEIRKKMNISYSTYDYNVRAYRGAIEEHEETEKGNRGGRPKGAKNKIIDVSGYTIPDKVFVDGEFEEVIEKNKENILALTDSKPEAFEQVIKPFISVEWMNTPDIIKSQLEALATVLNFESGKITIKLEVFKNGQI